MSAADRRESIVEAAMAEFAIGGLHGTATEAIAGRVGVSQPYLFRFFPTKKELFIAAVECGFKRVEEAFQLAAETQPEDIVRALGAAYDRLLQERANLLLQLHAYAACSDPEIQAVVRRRFSHLFHLVQELTGMTDEEIHLFFAEGMLMNVGTAMNLPSLVSSQPWAAVLVGKHCPQQ
jgi:AcrR family transcriptional regulator